METQSSTLELRIPAFGAKLGVLDYKPDSARSRVRRCLAAGLAIFLVILGIYSVCDESKIWSTKSDAPLKTSLSIFYARERKAGEQPITIPAIEEDVTVMAAPYNPPYKTTVLAAARDHATAESHHNSNLATTGAWPAMTNSLASVNSLPISAAVRSAESDGAVAVSTVDTWFQHKYAEKETPHWLPGQDQNIPSLPVLGTTTEGQWSSAPEIYGHHTSLLHDICIPQCDRCRKSATEWGCFQCTRPCGLNPAKSASLRRLHFKVVSNEKEKFEMSKPLPQMRNSINMMRIQRVQQAVPKVYSVRNRAAVGYTVISAPAATRVIRRDRQELVPYEYAQGPLTAGQSFTSGSNNDAVSAPHFESESYRIPTKSQHTSDSRMYGGMELQGMTRPSEKFDELGGTSRYEAQESNPSNNIEETSRGPAPGGISQFVPAMEQYPTSEEMLHTPMQMTPLGRTTAYPPTTDSEQVPMIEMSPSSAPRQMEELGGTPGYAPTTTDEQLPETEQAQAAGTQPSQRLAGIRTAISSSLPIVQRREERTPRARFIIGRTKKIRVLVPHPVVIPEEPTIPKLGGLKFFKKPAPNSNVFRNFDGQQMRVLKVVPESVNVTIDLNGDVGRDISPSLLPARDQAISGLLAAATANTYFDASDRSEIGYREYGEVAPAAGEPREPPRPTGGYPNLVPADPFHLLPPGQLPVRAQNTAQ